MNKKILVLFIVIFFTAIFYDVQNLYAAGQDEAVSKAVGEWMSGSKAAQYNSKLNSPFDKDKTGVRETIDPESGSITLNIPTMTVPSVNGMVLDADLTYRIYDAKDYEESANASGASINIGLSKAEKERTIYGAGFSLDLPYVEVRENVDTFVYLPGNGMYKADFKTGAGLEGYTIMDLVFEKDSSETVQGRKSAYRLTYPDGTRYYFSEDGKLLVQKDRFENAVYYQYGYFGNLEVLTGITDKFGRRIAFYYQSNQVTIINGDREYNLYLKDTGTGKRKELEKIEDPQGNITSFEYREVPLSYTLLKGMPSATNNYHIISGIRYQTGASTHYDYEKSTKGTPYGEMEYIRVKARKDMQLSKEYNRLTYQYWGEPDGYPAYKESTLPADYTYGRRVYRSDGTVYAYVYDEKHNLINKRVLFKNKTEEETNTVYDEKTKAPLLVKNTIFDDSDEQSLVTQEYEYDRNGNVTRSDEYETGHRGEQAVSYTYSLAYNLMTSEERKADANTTLKQVFALDGSQKKPIALTIYQNGKKVKNEQYAYDSSGNLTEKKTEKTEGNYDIFRYEYSKEYGGAYLTAEEIPGVKTADDTESIVRAEYTYDPVNGQLLYKKDPDGYRQSYRYDRNGRVVTETSADGNSFFTSYNDKENSIVTTDKRGTQLKYCYDPLGNLVRVEDLLTGNTLGSFAYDDQERKTRSQDALGSYQVIGYGKLDRIEDVKNYDDDQNLLSATTFTYDNVTKYSGKNALLLETVQGFGTDTATTRQYFDTKGNLIARELVGKEALAETFTYDYLGRCLSATDRGGNTSSQVYDALGNVITTRNPLGETAQFEYDLMGHKTKTISPGGKEVYYTYDSLGRLIKQRRNGEKAAEIIQNFYDGRGNLTKQINALGEITEYQYDAMSRNILIKTGSTDDGYMESQREYDSAGNLIGESYGLSGKEKRGVSYSYDHLGRRIKETDELGNSISYAYDAAGNLTSKTDKNGVTANYTYDGLGRLLTVNNDKDKAPVNYTYDGLGRPSRVTDSIGEYLFQYDTYSNLVQVRNPLEIKQNYAYDKMGRVTSYIEEQSGIRNQKLTYGYDKAGRLTSLYTDIANISYRYDSDGKLLTETNSTTNEITKYAYDQLSNLTQKSIWQKDKLQSSQKYAYDLLGRKTEEIIGDEDYRLYFYDSIGRLEETVEGGSSIKDAYSSGKITSYSYDPYSNLTEKSIWQDNGRLKETYTYNQNNQLTSKKVDDKTELFDYDKQGNLIQKKEILPGGSYFMSYTYDGKNRLAGVNNNGEVQSAYAYRYDGLRFSKTVDGNTKYFTYNSGNITSELTSSGTYNYYRGLSLIGMTDPQKEKYYYTQNNKGDIIGLKDAAGNEVKTYKYDPFGNKDTETEKLNFQGAWEQETSQVYNSFGYCGEYFDEETGFVYLRGRYYDPATERFITEDPMKDGGNWYTYCGNDPVNHVDPSGYFSVKKAFNNLKKNVTNQAKAVKNFYTGVVKGNVKVVNETYKAVTNPKQTATALKYAVNNPGKTANAIKTSVVASFKKDVINGNSALRGEFAGTVAMSVYGAKGTGTVVSATKKTATVVRGVKAADAITDTGKIVEKTAANSIKTPYGEATQSTAKEAVQIKSQVENGGALYRGGSLGHSNAAEGQFWATESPLNPNYADKYGVDFNKIDFVIGGKINPGSPIVTRNAPGLGINNGGAIEVVTNPNSVNLDFFYMP